MLAGLPPAPPKAGAGIRGRSPYAALTRIGLEVDPRLPSAAVKQLYGEMRSRIRKGGDREMTEKHLKLALFIARHGGRRPHTTGIDVESIGWRGGARAARSTIGVMNETSSAGVTWPVLQAAWNAEWAEREPSWLYDDVRARRFSRDVRSAWKRVTGQNWCVPVSEEEADASARKVLRRRPTP